jgi:hypothetical protein
MGHCEDTRHVKRAIIAFAVLASNCDDLAAQTISPSGGRLLPRGITHLIEVVMGDSIGEGWEGYPVLSDISINPTKVVCAEVGAVLPLRNRVEGTADDVTTCSPGEIAGQIVEQPVTAMGDELYDRDPTHVYVMTAKAACGGNRVSTLLPGISGGACAAANPDEYPWDRTWPAQAGSAVYDSVAAICSDPNARVAFGGVHNHSGEWEECDSTLSIDDNGHEQCGTAVSGSVFKASLNEYLDDVYVVIDQLAAAFPTCVNPYRPKMYLSQLGAPSSVTHRERSIVAQAQYEIARDQPTRFVLVTGKHHLSDGLDSIYPGNTISDVHLRNTAYRSLAEIHGLAQHMVTHRRWDWQPWPRVIKVDPSDNRCALLDYSYRIPCMERGDCVDNQHPLVFDTTHVDLPETGANPTNPLQGYEMVSPGPQPPHLLTATLAGVYVRLCADAPLQKGTLFSYGTRYVSEAYPGNGHYTIEHDDGANRGTLRDDTTRLGARSGWHLWLWYAAFFDQPLIGGVDPPAAIASVIEDIGTYEWGYDFANCPPTTGSPLVAAYGGAAYDLPYRTGTWSCNQTTGALTASAIGTARLGKALDPTNGNEACWGTTVASNLFDLPAGYDLFWQVSGHIERGANVDSLFTFRDPVNDPGGASPASLARIDLRLNNANGTLTYRYATNAIGGTSSSLGFTNMIPSPAQWIFCRGIDLAHGAAAGTRRWVICCNGTCQFSDLGPSAVFMPLLNLVMTLNGTSPCNTSASQQGALLHWDFARGNAARARYKTLTEFEADSIALYNQFCPSPPCN